MSIESLKQTARRHEQNEEWQKALDQYEKALAELASDDQVDIGLYNRVGDLYVRVGNFNSAFRHYDKSVDLYREAYLPNNAIAVCKKIIRNMPNRPQAFLRIGQIRAEQGFLPDARENFLTYAERMQQAGNIDESFRALIEFCDLAPDDVGVRVTVAENMAASGRSEEAVEQFLIARQAYAQRGDQANADALEAKVLALDPDADLSSVAAVVDAFTGASTDSDLGADFGEITGFGGLVTQPDEDDRPAPMASDRSPDSGEFELGGGEEDEDESELVVMGFEADDEEDESFELPTIDFGDEAEEEPAPLPTMDFGDGEEEGAAELPTMSFDEAEPEPSAALEEAFEDAPPTPKPGKVPAAGPPEGGYVDLGAMILGGGEEKSTRLTIAYQEPSGDEEADFAKMLSQFKEKISENLDSSDVRAHYDLGTAYKEMGLLDEAISSFQAALRASADHLPTYELMGQTFIEMGKPEAAVKSLRRALQSDSGIEDDLVGIYYYLARAYEALDDKPSAVEYYDRVFSLDINFADVTERLRELR